MDPLRHKDLDHMVRKMGGIISVFEIRSDPLGNRNFSAMRDVMDVYLDACTHALKEGKDFIDDGMELTDDQKANLKAALERVFGVTPDQL